MKKIKKYIILFLVVISAIFALSITACEKEDYDKDVVGVDGFTREEVIEIRHAYIKSYFNNKKSKLQYLSVKGNLGIYDGKIVAIVSYDGDPNICYPAVALPKIYVNGVYIATVKDASYSIVVVSNGECFYIERAYEAGIITDELLSQIIEVSKAKGLYDEKEINPPDSWDII